VACVVDREGPETSDSKIVHTNIMLRRKRKELSQSDLAKLINSSQSRVAKMEGGDPSVSIDLLIRSLLAMGATEKDLASAISS
jgi:transcriptional regulator with XRE-family HTH domain